MVVGVAVGLLAAACGATGDRTAASSDTSRDVSPDGGVVADATAAEIPDLSDAADRAVVVATAACGSADPTDGSGIALGPERVLTAAHVVASGGPIELTDDDATVAGVLVAYDPARDLAIVRPAEPFQGIPPPPLSGDLDVDDTGIVVGAARSGDVPAVVELVTVIEMDDVRATTRSRRRGYRIDANTGPGDSGAGLYDDDGRLIGLLFAVSSADDDRSWVTASSEIDAFLDDPSTVGTFACDPDRSRVAPAADGTQPAG
ncbi:MAG: serine protease [Actinomycetota bacterium]